MEVGTSYEAPNNPGRGWKARKVTHDPENPTKPGAVASPRDYLILHKTQGALDTRQNQAKHVIVKLLHKCLFIFNKLLQQSFNFR
jgi:hypothetical protein